MSARTLTIDHESCWGCKTCEVACKQEYDFRVKFLYVSEEGPKIASGEPRFSFHVHVCRHCDDPPCVQPCPVEAIKKREDGIVVLDEEKCTGCQLCIEACPYHAIGFDEENQTARKCNLCHHRVDQGLLPACADNVCLAHCIYFGDPKEIASTIQRRKQKRVDRSSLR